MKRSQVSSPSSSPPISLSPQLKRVKISQSQPSIPDDHANDDDEGGWTKVERRKAKKAQKVEVKAEVNTPRFMYVNGEIVQRKDAVKIDDIRELILHILANAPLPGWVKVENAQSIKKVVTLLVPGILPSFISLPPLPTSATANPNLPLPIPFPCDATQLPFISSTFSHACPTKAPGDQTRMHSVLSAFFQTPVSGEEKNRRKKQRIASERAFDRDPSLYLMSLEQMIENEYPIPSYMADVFQKPEGWVETPEVSLPPLQVLGEEVPMAKIYAIDCEMCLTEDGKELTRVCVIDYYSGIVLYDQLVKPAKPIVDYLTKWSGITAEALSTVTTTFEQVQSDILTLLTPPSSPTPTLLGHSLESDLKALKICHPRCIDTAITYHHPRGRPLKPGLAWLTKKWCGRDIQTRGEGGHDPEEDARACLDLLKLKVRNGGGFGEFKMDFESIFERMGRATGRGAPGSLRTVVVDHGKPSVMHGSKATTTVACESDTEVLQGLLESIPSHEFAFGRFTGVADTLGWLTPKVSTNAETPPRETREASPEIVSTALNALNSQLTTLYASLPPRTAFIIFTGHSDPRRMAALNARKAVYENAIRSGKTPESMDKELWWTASDSRELDEETEKAKRGLLFLAIK